MQHDALITRIRHLGRVHDPAMAERLATATLQALGPALPDEARGYLSLHLPEPHRKHLRAQGPELEGALLALFSRVSELSGLPEPAVRDHLPAVFGALSEEVGDKDLPRFKSLTPEYLAQLFVIPPPDMGTRPPEYIHPSHGSSLASGRPGSSRPLSDAAPSRGHRNSIANSDNPHGESKIATATGTHSEQLNRTLATGRPGHDKPVGGPA
ncbi:MAG: DUF2267 domain-containing protein [Deltaproteobacteria bacterium]|nr:MAG: DUF2267 domain-containing protein [Deltaproteobacteria bacterium]